MFALHILTCAENIVQTLCQEIWKPSVKQSQITNRHYIYLIKVSGDQVGSNVTAFGFDSQVGWAGSFLM